MAINSKTYDYLSRFCAEGMEKAHEEMLERENEQLRQMIGKWKNI